jgi:hypothetical protein
VKCNHTKTDTTNAIDGYEANNIQYYHISPNGQSVHFAVNHDETKIRVVGLGTHYDNTTHKYKFNKKLVKESFKELCHMKDCDDVNSVILDLNNCEGTEERKGKGKEKIEKVKK